MPTDLVRFLPALGRILLAALFLIAGFGKIADPAGTQGYIASAGLPAPLLGYLIALGVEIGGGLLLLAGYQVRLVSLVLAVFTVITALVFHNALGDANQMIQFLKNLAIAGGLLQVAAYGAGAVSLDARLARATA